MPNPENIIPHRYKKGESGNPKGRPPDLPELAELMAVILGEDDDAIRILKAIREKAFKGNIRAAEFLLDRAYGKPRQYIDHTTKGESFVLSPEQRDAEIELLKRKLNAD